MKLDKKIEKIGIEFTGFTNWTRFREILVLKMEECQTEEQFKNLFKALLGSCFTDADAVDEARKTLKLAPLSKEERKKIKSWEKK